LLQDEVAKIAEATQDNAAREQLYALIADRQAQKEALALLRGRAGVRAPDYFAAK
jgi:hypothetical protein